MPEVREEDEFELVLIPMKNVTPAIPKKEFEMRELVEDLTLLRCEGLLAKPWNLWNEAILRGFLFERMNQFVFGSFICVVGMMEEATKEF